MFCTNIAEQIVERQLWQRKNVIAALALVRYSYNTDSVARFWVSGVRIECCNLDTAVRDGAKRPFQNRRRSRERESLYLANSFNQRGVYLLHDREKVVYVGRSIDRPLVQRLYEHAQDRLNSRWARAIALPDRSDPLKLVRTSARTLYLAWRSPIFSKASATNGVAA